MKSINDITLPESLPSWERVLKLLVTAVGVVIDMSLPSWERVLKLRSAVEHFSAYQVAPFVGACVETQGSISDLESGRSLPSWERVLKHPNTAP